MDEKPLPMDITKFRVSSLCQVFTASTLSCCMFVGLSVFSLVFSNWKVCSIIGLGSGDWLGHWRIFNFFAFKKSWVAFAICLGSLSICEVVSYQFCSIWLNVSREYSLKDLRIHPATLSAVTSPINTSEAVPLQWYICPCHNTAATMFDTWCGVLWIVSCSFLSPYFSSHQFATSSFWFHQYKESYSRTWDAFFFRCFLAKCNLAFLFLNVTSGLHLIVKPLYLHSWRRLLIVDFDNDVPTLPPPEYSWSLLMLWRGFSSPRKGFCDHPL